MTLPWEGSRLHLLGGSPRTHSRPANAPSSLDPELSPAVVLGQLWRGSWLRIKDSLEISAVCLRFYPWWPIEMVDALEQSPDASRKMNMIWSGSFAPGQHVSLLGQDMCPDSRRVEIAPVARLYASPFLRLF